ncbi:glucose-1-phosphate adenylyltransferase subunit GlgD [Fusibacter tunisiensis]|jgi:glucose-1-phosphate adenylyltransferase|uniref:Glucose-1-phosphate adenylyltransferase n=1 Tax=Fusibacter tunisiensis TaxID=1008308 RepID=A0ABS2MSI0_9FIRM|nr:glucose-1-phosphate adenylyltransferase subunit GlgD [Fusibacter tunisiensis]MBM7562353.1 glucose-1-phosphate adenylyltransferase [Fusibacter tunisiensis]
MKNCLGIINMSENDSTMGALTQNRPTAMLPIAGRYRVIDFVLSNMVNSGITGIGVFTGNKVRSVMDHLGSGQPWDLDRKLNGLFVFTPTYDYHSIHRKIGDLELFFENNSFVKYAKQDYLLFSKSYMLANIDYNEAFKAFLESGADISIVYKKVKDKSNAFLGCDKIHFDDDGVFESIGTNLGMDIEFNMSMEMYFIKKSVYFEILYDAVEKGNANYLKQAIFNNLDKYKVHTHEFKGHVFPINTIKNYFNANMGILKSDIEKDLFFSNGHILTKVKDEPSTYYKQNAKVKNSFVANGCIIDGYVENSIIFRGVKIDKGCIIRNSIVMQKSDIQENVHLNYVILDKRAKVSKGVTLIGDPSSPYIASKKATITREGEQ